jgi:hypothetical protein
MAAGVCPDLLGSGTFGRIVSELLWATYSTVPANVVKIYLL